MVPTRLRTVIMGYRLRRQTRLGLLRTIVQHWLLMIIIVGMAEPLEILEIHIWSMVDIIHHHRLLHHFQVILHHTIRMLNTMLDMHVLGMNVGLIHDHHGQEQERGAQPRLQQLILHDEDPADLCLR